MMKLKRYLFASIGFVVLSALPAVAAPGYTLFGSAQLFSPGQNSPTAAQLRSDMANAASPYGGVSFDIPEGMPLSDLDTLSANFKFTEGSCGGGAPRFQVRVATPSGNKNLFVYLGSAPNYTGCALGVWENTGNLADGANLVDSSQLGGTFYDSYSNVQTAYGTYEIVAITLVVDGGWSASGTQTVLVDNIQINELLFSFESANTCKNDGWQLFTGAPGPFTNQGQCVSYYAKGGQ